MNKTVIVGGIVAVAIAVSIAYGAVANPGGDDEKRSDSEIWNFRFSGSEWKDRGGFLGGVGFLEKGYYKIGFVPMGDSPSEINIKIFTKKSDETDSRNFVVLDERYLLDRDLVDTGISKYYTWEYLGDKYFSISKETEYEIDIERIGNLEGSVSVNIEKVERGI